MAAVIICSDLGAQENKICPCFQFPPSVCHIDNKYKKLKKNEIILAVRKILILPKTLMYDLIKGLFLYYSFLMEFWIHLKPCVDMYNIQKDISILYFVD